MKKRARPGARPVRQSRAGRKGRRSSRARLGQHFLTDLRVVQDILDEVRPGPGDQFVEIGPGRGALTAPLVESGAAVHAVEIDRRLADRLRAAVPARRLAVHHEDALRFDYSALDSPALRLIGNLPYYISAPLLFRLLEGAARFSDMTVMLQREVAERLCAPPGSRRYGRLTVMAAARCRARLCFGVPPEAFTPPPGVQSAVVRLVPDSRHPVRRPEMFERLVRRAFSQRRKTIANALRGLAAERQIRAAGIDPGARAERIGAPQYLRLSELLP